MWIGEINMLNIYINKNKNYEKINLVVDQTVHLIQLAITWLIWKIVSK